MERSKALTRTLVTAVALAGIGGIFTIFAQFSPAHGDDNGSPFLPADRNARIAAARFEAAKHHCPAGYTLQVNVPSPDPYGGKIYTNFSGDEARIPGPDFDASVASASELAFYGFSPEA